MTTLPDQLSLDRDEQAAMWCLSFAEGELSPVDRIAFDRWLADPDNAQAFDEAAMLWNNADAAADMPELIHARAQALEHYRRANERRWRPAWSGRWHWISGIAATFVVALMSAFLLLHVPMQSFHTGIGERRVAMLADGSRLSLDADTEVDVRLGRNRRELTLLRGRAKFDVAKDPLRPFSVVAGGKMVVATGTSFSVELLGRQVHVLLYEGHVAVLERIRGMPVVRRESGSAHDAAADIALTPGKELVALSEAPAPASVSPVDPARSLSWEAGQLSFDDEPLSSAVTRMNRYSQERLAVGDTAAAHVRVNGVYTAGDMAAFVEGVTAVSPVRAVRDQQGVTLLSSR